MTTTSKGRKFTYNIINTQLWERESAKALHTIRTVGFLQKLPTVDGITKYRGIMISCYTIVRNFLIPRIPTLTFQNLITSSPVAK